MTTSIRTFRKVVLLLLTPALVLLAAAHLFAAEFSLENLSEAELKGFQTNGVAQVARRDGIEQVPWRIQSESAHVEKPNYTLSGFRMFLDGEETGFGKYRLESAQCRFNQEAHQIRGNGAVRLEGPDALVLSGIGYDFYWETAEKTLRVIVRDAVHIEFEIRTIRKLRAEAEEDMTNTPAITP